MPNRPTKHLRRLEWIALFYMGLAALILASGLLFSLNLLNTANTRINDDRDRVIKALDSTEQLIAYHIPLRTTLEELSRQAQDLKNDLNVISLDASYGSKPFLEDVETLERLAFELELLLPSDNPSKPVLMEAALTMADIADEAAEEVVVNNLHTLHEESIDPINEAKRQIQTIKKQLKQEYVDLLFGVASQNTEVQGQLQSQANLYQRPIGILSILTLLLLLMPLLLVFLLFRQTSRRIQLLEHYANGIAQENFNSPPFDSRDRTGSLARTLGALSNRVRELLETTRIQAQKARYQANHDYLTSLPNRRHFVDNLMRELPALKDTEKSCHLFFIDLDEFKYINDTMGHDSGDKLLQIIGKRLLHALSPKDFIARLGGDEFAALVCCQRQDVANISTRLLKQISQPLDLKEQKVEMTASIGVTQIYPDSSSEILLKQADIALYAAKQSGRNNHQLFAAELEEDINQRVSLTADLRIALEQGQFSLYVQPKIDIIGGHIVGVETLIRWKHPTKGLVSPAEFIPLAESSGLIVPIGEWVLRDACRIARGFYQRGNRLTVALNCSGRQLAEKGFVDSFSDIVRGEKFPLDMLELEVTETELMERLNESSAKLQALRKQGVQVAIDDFGTGYSSLRYLKNLPVNTIKIDRSFVVSAEMSNHDAAIIHAIVSLGNNLQLDVIAEGVETPSQLKLVRDLGVRHVQGFIYARPMPLAEFEHLLDETQAHQHSWRADDLIAKAI